MCLLACRKMSPHMLNLAMAIWMRVSQRPIKLSNVPLKPPPRIRVTSNHMPAWQIWDPMAAANCGAAPKANIWCAQIAPRFWASTPANCALHHPKSVVALAAKRRHSLNPLRWLCHANRANPLKSLCPEKRCFAPLAQPYPHQWMLKSA